MDKKFCKIKLGDYIFQYVGDISPKRNIYNDKYFITKYQVLDIYCTKPYTVTVKQIADDDISNSTTRHWYSDIVGNYCINVI